MERLHDVKSAAQILAISPWTVRLYIRNGRLQPIRLGRLVRIEEEELRRFVAESRGFDATPLLSDVKVEAENG